MKICKKCKEPKRLEEFAKVPRNKDGLHSYCRPCSKVLSKRRREKQKPIEKQNFNGYETFINKKGVKCITNFDPYNMGIQKVSKPKSVILESKLIR